MIEAPTLEQLYDRQQAALKTITETPNHVSPYWAVYLSAKADYDRALIVAARARQREHTYGC